MERNEYYASLSLDEIVNEINSLPEWDVEQLYELCYRADLEDEFDKADDMTFEMVAKEAADKLEVGIIGINVFPDEECVHKTNKTELEM